MEKTRRHLNLCLRYLRIFMYVIIGVLVMYGGYGLITTDKKIQIVLMTLIYIVMYGLCIKLVKKEEQNVDELKKISVMSLMIIAFVGFISGFIVLIVAIYTYYRALMYNRYLKEGRE